MYKEMKKQNFLNVMSLSNGEKSFRNIKHLFPLIQKILAKLPDFINICIGSGSPHTFEF